MKCALQYFLKKINTDMFYTGACTYPGKTMHINDVKERKKCKINKSHIQQAPSSNLNYYLDEYTSQCLHLPRKDMIRIILNKATAHKIK